MKIVNDTDQRLLAVLRAKRRARNPEFKELWASIATHLQEKKQRNAGGWYTEPELDKTIHILRQHYKQRSEFLKKTLTD